LFACTPRNPQETNISTIAVSDVVYTTNHIKSPAKTINLVEMKKISMQQSTYNDLKKAYNLHEYDDGMGLAGNTITAKSDDYPGILFYFGDEDVPKGELKLISLAGMASDILPEYVGTKIDELPMTISPHSSDETLELYDESGMYVVFLSQKGILSANDHVSATF
jgi:hypothetical protein